MQPVSGGLVLFPHSRLRFVAVPDVLLPSEVAIENRLMLEFVAPEAPGERVLRPDDLTSNCEPGLLDRILKLTLPGGGMAHIQRSAGLHGAAIGSKRIIKEF